MAVSRVDLLEPMKDFLGERERKVSQLRENVSALEAALDVAKLELALAEGTAEIVECQSDEGHRSVMIVAGAGLPLFLQDRVISIIEDYGDSTYGR